MNLFIGSYQPITKLFCFFHNLLLQIKNKNTRKFGKKEDLKEILDFCFSHPPLCCSARVFIGDFRRRVPIQLSHENALPDLSKRPRKRGHGHVSMVKVWLMATHFLTWPPLVRPSGRLLLDSAFWSSILRIQDNLGSKLSKIRIWKGFGPFIFILKPFSPLSLSCSASNQVQVEVYLCF